MNTQTPTQPSEMKERHHFAPLHGTNTVIKDVCHRLSDSLHHRHHRKQHHIEATVDVFERNDFFLLLLDVAGTHHDDLEVTVEGDTLHIHGHTSPCTAIDHHDFKMVTAEYDEGEFCRRIRLGGEIDVEAIEARIAHGVLSLHLPKLKKSSKRNIEVETQVELIDATKS